MKRTPIITWSNEDEALKTKRGRAWLILHIQNMIIEERLADGLSPNISLAHAEAQQIVLKRMGKIEVKR